MQIRLVQPRELLLCLMLLLISPALLSAQTQSQTQTVPSSKDQKQTNAEARKALVEIESHLKSLNQKPAFEPALKPESDLFLIAQDSLKDVRFNRAPNGIHFFLTRLILVNAGTQPLKLERKQINVLVDGAPHPIAGILPRNLSYESVQLQKGNQRLNQINFADAVEIAPGKQDGLWILLTDLPGGGRIPEIEFQVTVNDQRLLLNVNRFELGKLHHTVQLMGPSRCLAELTITGELNSINIGSLVQQVEVLTTKKIKRFVIYFPNQKSIIDKKVEQWLPRVAASLGTNSITGPPFPLFPSVITELHLAGEAFKDTRIPYMGTSSGQVTHSTEEAAIHAALDSAMEILSREKIADQIRTGSPAIKVAALISGGRQLTSEEVPLVLNLTRHSNDRVQEAALYALRFLGDPRVFQRLVEVAQMPPGPQFEMAIASLAESRYATGQHELLKMLKTHPPESQKLIIGIMARTPRPEWGPAIYEFLSSDNQELKQAAIRALVLNGHPKLFEVLTDALQSPQPEIRRVAFQELIKRQDNASESLAMDYVLQQLHHSPPTPEMLAFIDRMKEPRAVPLLFPYLENKKLASALRVSLIKTLASIGDETVEDRFLTYYPKAQTSEKLLILSTLQKVESSSYFKLAQQALDSSDHSIVNGAVQGLRTSGSNEAIRILTQTLQTTDKPTTWKSIFGALVTIGTPEARHTIMDARQAGEIADKKQAAWQALDSIYQRSPGNHYLKKGEQLHGRKQYKEAIAEYQTAISIDSLLVPAYLGIANSQNALKQYDAALKSIDQGLEIDGFHSRLYVTKGLIYSNQDQPAKALSQFEKAIEIAPQDAFAYTVLASHYARINQHDKALATYDASIKANPRYMNTYEFKADLEISLNRPDEAIKTYDRAIEVNSRYMKAYYSKISLLRKLKRQHQALAVCDDILKVDKNSINAFLTKAYIFRDLSQIDEAITASNQAILIKPDEPQSYLVKAQMYNEIEQWDNALRTYDQIIQLDSKNETALVAFNGRGHTNLQKQDWKAAQRDFQKAFELNSKSSQAITGLAICMVYNHQEDKAIEFVEANLKKFDQDKLFQYNVACVFGRALINLKEQEKTPAVLKQTAEYQQRALEFLSAAARLGFDEFDWMQKDPDLAELHHLPAFRELILKSEKAAKTPQ